jgi:hypothetical protein
MKFRVPYQLLLPWSPRYTISTAHAAEMMDTSIQTVTRLIEGGVIKAYKLRDKPNSAWHINYDSVVAYIESIHQHNGLEKRF